MAFEEFKKVKGKFSPRITISPRGAFGLSSGMHHRFKIDQFAGAKLYYDRDEEKIGIKLMEQEGEGIFKLKKRDDEKGAYFSAWSFIEAYNIKNFAGRYLPQEVEDQQFGKMFVIDLRARDTA